MRKDIKMIRISTILTILFCLTPNAVWSTDFKKGLAAAEKGDFATTLREWRPLAKQGDADAQIFLGGTYAKGSGLSQDRFIWVYYMAKDEVS
jgi:TPR repeat protein